MMIPRKNSKTTMAAAAILFVLYCDAEPGARVYGAASEAEQARECFTIVADMVRAKPELMSRAELFHRHMLVGGGLYRSLTASAGSKHSLNAHMVVLDELHAHPTPELANVLMTSQGTRTQPITLHTTTSDFERPNSICNQKHDYGSKVRDGIIDDPAFLPVIYEATIDDDWTDPKIWRKANPNLGVSISEEYLDRECKRAQEEPSFENTFKRLHLNIRTEQETRLIPMEAWNGKCNGALPDLDGRECYGGLDLASTQDITALVLVFPIDGKYILKPYFWIPLDGARRRERADRVPYLQWIREGHITGTPGVRCDYSYLRRDINALDKQFKIRELAIDPWNADQLYTQLAEEDGWGERALLHGQTTKDMNGPTLELEAAVASGRIIHGGNPVLTWMASNVAADTDSMGNIRPSKKKSTEKIDGIVATCMGIGRATVRTDKRSVYETRGLISV